MRDELIELAIDPIENIPAMSPIAQGAPPKDYIPVSHTVCMPPTPIIPVNSQPLSMTITPNMLMANITLDKDVPVFNASDNSIKIQNVFSIRPTAGKSQTVNITSSTINEILNNNQINRDHTLATVTPIRPSLNNSQKRVSLQSIPTSQPIPSMPVIGPNQIFIQQNMIRMNEIWGSNQSMAKLIPKPAQIPIGIARPQSVRHILPKPGSVSTSIVNGRVFIQTTNARTTSFGKLTSPTNFISTMATVQPIQNSITPILTSTSTTTTTTTATATPIPSTAIVLPPSQANGRPRIILVKNPDGKIIYKRAEMHPASSVATSPATTNKNVISPVRTTTSAASNPQLATILNKNVPNAKQKPFKGVLQTKPTLVQIKRPVPDMLKIHENMKPVLKTYAPAASSAAATSSTVQKSTSVSTNHTLNNSDPGINNKTRTITAIEKTKIPTGLTVRALSKELKFSNAALASGTIEIIDLSDDEEDANPSKALNQSAPATTKAISVNDANRSSVKITRKSLNTAITNNSAKTSNVANAADISATTDDAQTNVAPPVVTSGYLISDNLTLGKQY